MRGDWRSAPVGLELRTTLGFLEKLTLSPEALTREDAGAVLSAGVAEDALVDAIVVAALFSMIVRLADSFAWRLPTPEHHAARAQANLESGYSLMTPADVPA